MVMQFITLIWPSEATVLYVVKCTELVVNFCINDLILCSICNTVIIIVYFTICL